MSPAAPRRLPLRPVCSATLLKPKRLTRSPASAVTALPPWSATLFVPEREMKSVLSAIMLTPLSRNIVFALYRETMFPA